jgi:sphinganine-1-phosphate aldolase
MPGGLPEVGIAADEVLQSVQELHRADPYEAPEGKAWGGVYHDHSHHPQLQQLQADVWRDYNASNALYPGSWPSLQKYEAELVYMVVDLLNGDDNACGLLTSGGSESIMVAALGYRELAKQRGIDKPEIVCGMTAHGAIHKACHYFGIKLTVIPADPSSMQLTPEIVAGHLTEDTIAIYASAPTFPHGVIDDVTGLGRLAEKHGCGLHVDNCLGGILLSFMQQNGELTAKPFDFSVPGVTTMSCDVHKYGYASKGSSVVAFHNKELRRLTWHPVVNVSGGFYVTPTLQGARAGANIAQAWATMMHIGADGYKQAAKELHATTELMKAEIASIPGLQLLCESDAAIIPVVCVGSGSGDMAEKALDQNKLVQEMGSRGWNIFTSRHPKCISVCVGEQHQALLQGWSRDLRESVEVCRQRARQDGQKHQQTKTAAEEIRGPYSAGDGRAKESAKELRAVETKLRDYLERQFEVARL